VGQNEQISGELRITFCTIL